MGKYNGGGFGGGNNMQQLMRQAQKMQQDIKAAQEELADTEVVATAAGGMVEVVSRAGIFPIKLSAQVGAFYLWVATT